MDETEPPAANPLDAASSPDPGERRLDRPPSERYRPTAIELEEEPHAGSPARALAFAVLAAIVVAVLITVLGGVVLISAGLVVVAAAGGWAIALALRIGAGPTLEPARRRLAAVGIALVSVVLGQIGLWLFARTEGGVLPPIEYLAETFGVLVPLQAVVAAVAAAWTAR